MRLNTFARAAVVGVVVASALIAVQAQAPAGAAGKNTSAQARAAATPATTRTIALGVDARPTSGQSAQGAVTQIEGEIGHKLAFTRDFLNWDSPFPTSYENWLGARGTVPMISVKSRLSNGTAVPWASVAAAQPGSALYNQIKGWADKIKAFGYPIYFTFNHEPEAATNDDLGTPADFIAAWRKVHAVFAAEGTTNAKFMWIMTSYAFKVPTTDRRYGWDWYPGDAYVDGVAADAYNEANCRYPNGKWESLATVISGFMTFGAQHPTIPMWLTEFGTIESSTTPGLKAQWIADAQALFKQPAYAQIVGVSYFNQTRLGTACDWHIETSASATAAMATMAQDPFYQGVVSFTPPPPIASFTSNCTNLSCTFDGSGSTGSSALTYKWTFGDGGSSTQESPSYTYAGSGTHSVTLTVTDTSGTTASVSHTVTVTAQTAPTIAFVGSASTTANSATETVQVPATVTAGDGLVLIATNASPDAITAPSGWKSVATTSSPTMDGAVWQRVAGASDAGSAVAVKFAGVDKGSVELLAYSGTSSAGPVQTAVGATSEMTSATLTTPALAATGSGQLLLSYWAGRTSADTTLTPPAGVTVRSSETGSGGGRVTSAAADRDTSVPGGLSAAVSPAAGHAVTWSVLLAPAS